MFKVQPFPCFHPQGVEGASGTHPVPGICPQNFSPPPPPGMWPQNFSSPPPPPPPHPPGMWPQNFSSPPPPPPPPAVPQQYYFDSSSSSRPSASESTGGLKIQTVKNGTQNNKNSGKIRIGNFRGQAIPASMAPTAAAVLSRPIDFQSVDGGGTQTNENTGDIDIANWG